MFKLPSGKLFKNETAIYFLILKHGGIKENTSNKLILNDGYYIEYVVSNKTEE